MVERIDSSAVQHEARLHERGHEKSHTGKSRGHKHAVERREDVRTQQAQVADPAPRTTRAHGALRRLQEDHFQGMADLRLRRNFHQEIERLEIAAARERIDGATAQLLRDVSGEIDTAKNDGTIAPATFESVSAFHAEFEFTATRYAASYDPADAYGFNELTTRLEQAFDTLVTALRDLFAALGDVAPGNARGGSEFRLEFSASATYVSGTFAEGSGRTVAPDRTPTENVDAAEESQPATTSALDSFFERLTATFDSALRNLTDAATQRLFPELAAPNTGSGSYESFVSVYRETFELNIVFQSAETAVAPEVAADDDQVTRARDDDDDDEVTRARDDEDDDDDIEIESRDDAVGGGEPIDPEPAETPAPRQRVFVSV